MRQCSLVLVAPGPSWTPSLKAIVCTTRSACTTNLKRRVQSATAGLTGNRCLIENTDEANAVGYTPSENLATGDASTIGFGAHHAVLTQSVMMLNVWMWLDRLKY